MSFVEQISGAIPAPLVLANGATYIPALPEVFQYDSLDVAYQFNLLRNAWRSEYGASSSSTFITHTPSYLRIVFLGKSVLPYIFRDLQKSFEPDFWFVALREITQENPVPDTHRGNRRAMANDWIKWAQSHGYLG